MKINKLVGGIVTVILLLAYFLQNSTEESLDSAETQSTAVGLNLRNIVSSHDSGILIEHKGFTLNYNTRYNTPNWVAWELTAEECQSDGVTRKGFNFIPDEDLPYQYQVTTSDYTNSGYDRGHMCPAADMKWDADAMHDCFYMTNICPQVPVVNQQYWERLESACRRWAVSEGSIYIICGPIYNSSRPKNIGREHMIAVPDAFFKVVISLSGNTPKGIGFYYQNSEKRQTMESASRTIDQIEEMTGYDFFPELPDSIEDDVESQNNLTLWR